MTARELIERGKQFHRAGRLHEAEQDYRAALQSEPANLDAMHLLGLIAFSVGRLEVAHSLISRAVSGAPGLSNFRNSLGVVLKQMRRTAEAVEQFDRALEASPNAVEVLVNRSDAMRQLGDLERAAQDAVKAIALNPAVPEAHNNLGIIKVLKHDFEAAEKHFRTATELNPAYLDAWTNRVSCAAERGDLDLANQCARRATEIAPESGAAWLARACVENLLGNHETGRSLLEKAVALNPNLPDAHYNLATALLLDGEWERGWEEYEWRWKSSALRAARPEVEAPQWNGESVAGKSILIYTEQGFGDSLMLARYVPLVAQQGARVTLAASSELSRLFHQLPGVTRHAAIDDLPADCDMHCPMASLPRALSVRPDAIGPTSPYFRGDPVKSEEFDRALSGDDRLRVGIAWSGRGLTALDRARSIPLPQLLALQSDAVRLISAQKSTPGSAPADPSVLRNFDDQITDFLDLAALIEQMDLVISIDTATAHLAGAMGKPVWLLLPFVSDWRWLKGRSDSVWYPTMRLFRQPRAGAWDDVLPDVRAALGEFLAGRRN